MIGYDISLGKILNRIRRCW